MPSKHRVASSSLAWCIPAGSYTGYYVALIKPLSQFDSDTRYFSMYGRET